MRISIRLCFFIVLSCITLIAVRCKKESSPVPAKPKPGIVKGKVTNEYGQLLNGATVTIQGTGLNFSRVAVDGQYFFDTLQPASYTFTVKKEGYIETSETVALLQADTITKDFVLKAGTAYFRLLSDTLINAKPFSTSFSIKVESNVSWEISSANSWVTPVRLNADGNDSVKVNIAASPEDSARTHTLIVKAGSIEKKIVIKQMPDVKLLQVIPVPGNSVRGIRDSISLIFNQQVTIFSIFPGYTFCQSDIRYTYSGNKVTFSYACAGVGGEYPFTIATRNIMGDQYTFAFTANFYDKAFKITGSLKSFSVDDTDNSYWILASNPNALYKIDMNTLQLLRKYDLPYEPVMFTINPFNDKIYLSYNMMPQLYVMNKSGVTEQIIDIIHDKTRTQYENGSPRINPVKLAFTKNGKGMIWLSNGSMYAYSGFWYIDAADNHRIWYQSLPGEALYYQAAQANFDKTKLVLTSINEDPTISIFNPEQMSFSSYKPTKSNRGGFNMPNRKNNDIYSGQLSAQLIVNPETGYESIETRKYLPYGYGSVDFCYSPGKEHTVYYSSETQVGVMDYKTGLTPVTYDATYSLTYVTAPLNGKYILMSGHDGNYNIKVVQVNATWFNY